MRSSVICFAAFKPCAALHSERDGVVGVVVVVVVVVVVAFHEMALLHFMRRLSRAGFLYRLFLTGHGNVLLAMLLLAFSNVQVEMTHDSFPSKKRACCDLQLLCPCKYCSALCAAAATCAMLVCA
jgi:hypothetical protein